MYLARCPRRRTECSSHGARWVSVVRCAQSACFACLFASALAQTDNQEPVLRITTNLVQVDAVVTDPGGRQVSNLRANDFEILEDGRPQKITRFLRERVWALRSADQVRSSPMV
jgi:hypothetical protein